MRTPHKQGMKVDGRAMDLENYLLNYIERPLPKAPTHYVVADVLNTDLSIKRITLFFNHSDTWQGYNRLPEGTPESVGFAIGEGLAFLDRDPNTLSYKFWIMDILTNEVIQRGHTYSLNKCDI